MAVGHLPLLKEIKTLDDASIVISRFASNAMRDIILSSAAFLTDLTYSTILSMHLRFQISMSETKGRKWFSINFFSKTAPKLAQIQNADNIFN